MRVAHFGDQHANSNLDKYIKSTNQIKEYLETNNTDLILSGGDLFDSRVHLSTESNFILDSFAEFSNIAPIVIVYGTPSHDARGCLDLLPSLAKRYPILLISEINNDIYHFAGKDSAEVFRKNYEADHGAYVFGVPWLMKARLLTSDEMKVAPNQQEEAFKKKIQDWTEYHQEFYKKSKIPVLMTGHLQFIGSVFSRGQDISSEYHDPKWFENICDYGALNHIHRAHNINNLHFSGSIFNKTWNELEDKYFNFVNIEKKGKTEVHQIKLDTPLLIKADLESVEEYEKFVKDWIDNKYETDNKKIELWINLTVKSKEAFGYESALKFWKSFINLEQLRFDISEIKLESQHREKIEPNMTTLAKAEIWVKSKGTTMTDWQKQKIVSLENNE